MRDKRGREEGGRDKRAWDEGEEVRKGGEVTEEGKTK